VEKKIIPLTKTADTITAAQNQIIAGVKNNDPLSIKAGKEIWSQVWPKNVVESASRALIEDIEKEKNS